MHRSFKIGKKGRFDLRDAETLFRDLLDSVREDCKTIDISLTYAGQNKPTILVKESKEDQANISEWLPAKPFVEVVDDTTGQSEIYGHSSWNEYMESSTGLLNKLSRIVKASGRSVNITVEGK